MNKYEINNVDEDEEYLDGNLWLMYCRSIWEWRFINKWLSNERNMY